MSVSRQETADYPNSYLPTWAIPPQTGSTSWGKTTYALTIHRATKETAIFRNRFITALADAVLIASAHPGSSTEQLAKEVLGLGKPVRTLPHESATSLRAIGAKLFER